eukprot:CAMPEP_0173120160 /NCGR_PEP_ID=MMETSP1102-20130122/52288_1 /TAXON_ID=49646 /ORGANISM="Geminigera sp., Strain Caron Lab Isolate" /LENGTH=57 /DNA_ID=CAMNT_0014026049 /DNA_START=62 /DNA_END=232 /DNA_ORIENTATION=-
MSLSMDMDDSRLGSIDEWEDGDNDVYARVIQGSDSSLTPAYSHSGSGSESFTPPINE